MFVTPSQNEVLPETEGLASEHEAFEALIREHQRMIHSLCYRMTGSLTDADDLAQETFIHAYQHFAEFRAEARFSSWIYRIAVNLCLNRRKREQRLDRLHQQWAEQTQIQQEVACDAALSQQVQEALMRLNPKPRAAIVLTVYDGLSHAEAARILGCCETTVSWRVFAARRALKRLLSRKHAVQQEITEQTEARKR